MEVNNIVFILMILLFFSVVYSVFICIRIMRSIDREQHKFKESIDKAFNGMIEDFTVKQENLNVKYQNIDFGIRNLMDVTYYDRDYMLNLSIDCCKRIEAVLHHSDFEASKKYQYEDYMKISETLKDAYYEIDDLKRSLDKRKAELER